MFCLCLDYTCAAGATKRADLGTCDRPTSQERTEVAPKPSFTSSSNAKQVTLIDCCSAVLQQQVGGRNRKAKGSSCDEQDKSCTGDPTTSLKGGRDGRLRLSLRHKQPQQLPKLVKSSPATTNSIKKASPISNESENDVELSPKHNRPKRRLQPMRAAKRLKLIMDQASKEGKEDNEQCSHTEPKRVKSSPILNIRSRRRKSSSLDDDNDEDCVEFETSSKYSSPLRKQPRRAVKRLNFGADPRNGVGEDGESLRSSLPIDGIELDRGVSGGSSGQSSTLNMEHIADLKGVDKETSQHHMDSTAEQVGERNSTCRGSDCTEEYAPIEKGALQSHVEEESPLPSMSRQSTSEEPQISDGTMPPIASQSQSSSSGLQSSANVLIKTGPPADSSQQLSASEVHVRVLSHAVEYLEKQRRHREACALLQYLLALSQHGRSRRGLWFDRLALNLDFHLKRQNEVSLFCN